MKIIDHCNLDACGDCLFLVANGDTPEGDTGQLAEAIDAEWGQVSDRNAKFHGAAPNQLRWDLVCGGEHENPEGDDLGFSWSSCDCCGSTLGGSRHALTALLVRV